MSTSATTHDPDVADILQLLIDWHAKRVAGLQSIVDNETADILFAPPDEGGDGVKIKGDSPLAQGIRQGVAIALESLGKLPITLSKVADPWEEGYQAHQEGRPMSACPYLDAGEKRVDWEGGWISAEEEE